jgi:3-dehydroquinate synthase
MTHSIPVSLPDSSYNVAIAPQQLPQLGTTLKTLKLGKKILVISNPDVFNVYGETVMTSLEDAGFETASHLIAAGESHKTLATVAQIYDMALGQRLERSSTLLALGGGVIGDMTGFAAATWLRGIHFVQVPTSLLAMVDASIGGKTGVNHPQGKNLIGAFYQPKLVYIDPLVLKTLPDREFRAGMAEVIKYGVIWDRELFALLEQAPQLATLQQLTPDLLTAIIARSCQAKVDVVTQDEKEAGLRAILNYGHTMGHAIESLTGYGAINHGEAVALGMIAVGRMATHLGLWSTEDEGRQRALIAKAGLETCIPQAIAINDLLNTLQWDKKVKDGKIRFILPDGIGKAVISDQITERVIREAITEVTED